MKDPSKYIDDETIAPTCNLLRRIHPEWIVEDKNSGGMRISSMGFNDPTMSIHIGDDLAAAGHPVETVLEKYQAWGLAAIKASTARALEQRVCREDVPDELCHGIVAGKKTKNMARVFAKEATTNWIVRRPR